MPEGLSAAEVGKEIAEHKKHAEHAEHGEDEHDDRHERWLSIVEAVLLSAVALLAAYSGFRGREVEHGVVGVAGEGVRAPDQGQPGRPRGARHPHARFGLVQRLVHARSSPATSAPSARPRTASARDTGRRSTPGWPPIRQQPERSAGSVVHAAVRDSPAGPGERARRAGRRGVHRGSDAGGTADKYVRDTVFLATVLFLIGISGHLKLRQARYGLVVHRRAAARVLGVPARWPAGSAVIARALAHRSPRPG